MNATKLSTVLWGGTLCIALGLIVYLVQVDQRDAGYSTDEHASEYEPEALLNRNADSLMGLEIIVKGELSRLEKNPSGQWFNHTRSHDSQVEDSIQKPHKVNGAESARLARGIAMLARIRVDRIVQQGEAIDRSLYGLDYPQVIALAYADGVAPILTLHVGDLAPDGIGRYIYIPGIKSVAIVPDYQATNIATLISPNDR